MGRVAGFFSSDISISSALQLAARHARSGGWPCRGGDPQYMQAPMAGPLKGIRIVEMGGIGPAPFAAMMLADHGAEVIRVERAGMIGFQNDPLLRSRRSISLDLKQDAARAVV